MIKIIAIIGEAGSGKDYLAKQLAKEYPSLFHEIISCTTRPKRENEIDGVDYYFLSPKYFEQYKNAKKMLETSEFRGWYYGTLLNSLSETKVNLGVFNPEGAANIQKQPEVETTIFRLIVPAKIRLVRQLTREDNPDCDEIIRRYGTDKQDFMDLPFNTIDLPNNNFSELKNNLSIISKYAAAWDNNS